MHAPFPTLAVCTLLFGQLLATTVSHAEEGLGDYSAPPVTPEAATAARATITRDDRPGEGSRIWHRFTFPDGTVVEFQDRPKGLRDTARRERVVSHVGSHSAAAEPDETFTAAGQSAGLSPAATTALRYVSRHEGGFDAINTWDSARFSWGFIQFAGGYGLRPMLAYLKTKSPETFRNLLAVYGIDVLPDVAGRPEPVCISPAGTVLRGAEAEQAFGDDPLLIAIFIRSGGNAVVKQRQVEAAIAGYAAPAMAARHGDQLLSHVLSTPQGLAMLIDRQVHDGNVGRLRWALEQARIQQGVTSPQAWPELEGLVLDLAIQDADARATVATLVERAAVVLQRAISDPGREEATAAGDAETPMTSMADVLAMLREAVWQTDFRLVVGPRRDMVRAALSSALSALSERTLVGQTGAVGKETVNMTVSSLRAAVAPFRYEHLVRNRLLGIRHSDLPGPPIALDVNLQN